MGNRRIQHERLGDTLVIRDLCKEYYIDRVKMAQHLKENYGITLHVAERCCYVEVCSSPREGFLFLDIKFGTADKGNALDRQALYYRGKLLFYLVKNTDGVFELKKNTSYYKIVKEIEDKEVLHALKIINKTTKHKHGRETYNSDFFGRCQDLLRLSYNQITNFEHYLTKL